MTHNIREIQRAELLSRTLHQGVDCPLFPGVDAAEYIARMAWVINRFSKQADKEQLMTTIYLSHSTDKAWLAPGVRALNKRLLETFYHVDAYRLIKQLHTAPVYSSKKTDKAAWKSWICQQNASIQEIVLSEQVVRLALAYEMDLVSEKVGLHETALPLQIAEELAPSGSALCEQIKRLSTSWQGVHLKRHRDALQAAGVPEIGRSLINRWLHRQATRENEKAH